MGVSGDTPLPGLHIPALYHQVLTALCPRAGGHHIDCTLGTGGHAVGILEATAPNGRILGLDRDETALSIAAGRLSRFGDRAILVHGSFNDLTAHTSSVGWSAAEGILFDLGLSSPQLEAPLRGFSFRFDGPLDMRFDRSQPLTASDLVNGLGEEKLVDLLNRYGEEPRAREVARAIIAARPLDSTLELAEAVARVAGRKRRRFHPATRTFQALRIAVNDELGALERGLSQAVDLLTAGGRLVVISYHSLEDRIVKHFLREESKDCLCPPEQITCVCNHAASLRLITARPTRPSADEVQSNPRARSALLRAAERL